MDEASLDLSPGARAAAEEAMKKRDRELGVRGRFGRGLLYGEQPTVLLAGYVYIEGNIEIFDQS